MTVCDSLIKVSEALNKVYTEVPDDLPKVTEKVEFIKQTLEQLKVKTDVISGIVDAWEQGLGASIVESAARIAIAYGNVVDAINKIATFKPERDKVNAGLNEVTAILQGISASTQGHGGIFHIFSSVDAFAGEVEKLKSIVQNYLEMVPTFQDLGKNENQISNKLKTAVEKNIENIKEIVEAIGTVDTGGWIDTKESDVKKIQSILNNFKEMIPTLQSLRDMDTNFGGWNLGEGYTGVRKKIEDIKEIVLAIGEVDTGGWIDQKESDIHKIQSILNKFTELAQTTHHFGKEGYSIADGALDYIKNVRHMVWEISQINTGGSDQLETKEKMVSAAISVAQKFKELQVALKELDTTDYTTLVSNMVTTVNNLLNGVSADVSNQLDTFQNLGVKLSEKLSEGMRSVSFENVGAQIQTQFWWAIQNRMNDEYYQGRSMGETFRQGLYDVDYGNAGWWAVQGFINGAWGRAGNSDGVYNTGWWIADRFLRGLKDRGEQGSPWKTTMESGEWAVEGLIEGIKSSENSLVMEAESLADKLVDTLTMDDISISPTLTPSVDGYTSGSATSDYGMIGNNRNVVVNQTNNVYTDVDMDRISANLAWDLSKI